MKRRAVLAAAVLGCGDVAGLGVGTANPGAPPPPGLPLGDLAWSGGGWFDLLSVPGIQGDPITAGVASQAGSNSVTPASSPLVNDRAVGGRRGANVVDTGVSNTQPRFSCNALASLFPGGQAWSVVWDFRQSKQADMPLWSALSSTTTDAMGCRSVAGQLLSFRYRSTATGIVTVTGTINLAYDYHILAATYDGADLRLFVDGALDPATPVAVPALAIALNRWSWLASTSSATFEAATGFARRIAVSPSYISPAQVATVVDYFRSLDTTLPPSDALVPEFIMAGASIMAGTTDTVTVAGYRAGVSKFVLDGALSWASVGNHPQGIVPTRNTPSQSGESANSIMLQVINNATARTSLVVMDLGNQAVNVGRTAAQTLTEISNALNGARAAVYALNPNAQFVQPNMCPYWEPAFNAVVGDVNLGLPALQAASDALFPGSPKVLAADFNTAIGGPSFVAANYVFATNDHPNNTGYNLLIPALLGASNSDGQTLSNWLATRSPT